MKFNCLSIKTLPVIIFSVLIILSGCRNNNVEKPLVCHVGGTMRPVTQKLAELYTAKTGIPVEINSAGSGELLAHIEMQKKGDIYICHDPFTDILMKKKLGIDAWTVAELTPVIVVRKGNPKKINGLNDLTRNDVNLILTDYKLSTLGRMLPIIFTKAGIDFNRLNSEKKIVINKSGSYAANYIKMSNADASIVWNAVYELRKNALDRIEIPTQQLPIPDVDAVTSATGKAYKLTPVKVTVSTLKCSSQPEKAGQFARFLTSPAAERVFSEYGFTIDSKTVGQYFHNGIRVSEMPIVDNRKIKLRAYIGAGLRPAFETLIKEFLVKTGITVEPDYGGSGMIITRAREDRIADLFIPGDIWYVNELHRKSGLIASITNMAYFIPVIITQKNNPEKIKGLNDFIRNDIRTAIGQPDACQIGRLTKKIFRKNNIDISQIKTRMESLTVNELGVWIKMGRADAAIVWDAIATNIAEDVNIIKIPSEKNIISTVAIGIMTTSPHPAAADKFVKFITGPTGKSILKKHGYSLEMPNQSKTEKP
jgi:molybdate transport system substrate-binding protein